MEKVFKNTIMLLFCSLFVLCSAFANADWQTQLEAKFTDSLFIDTFDQYADWRPGGKCNGTDDVGGPYYLTGEASPWADWKSYRSGLPEDERPYAIRDWGKWETGGERFLARGEGKSMVLSNRGKTDHEGDGCFSGDGKYTGTGGQEP
jgi:hypothetical protein